MAEPRTAKLTGTVQWTNGENFDGFVLLALCLPNNADGTWPTATLDGATMKQRLPQWTLIKITDGAFDQEAKLYFTDDIEPPNCKYAAFWYSWPRHRVSPAIGVEPTLFSVSADPYAIAIPSLTAPTAATTAPVPRDT